jgi:hypothetical protein
MKVLLVAGLGIAVLGLVLTVGASWMTTMVSCGIGTTSCPNRSSFEINSGTYFGMFVGICGVATAGVDLIRTRTRTRYLRDFPK